MIKSVFNALSSMPVNKYLLFIDQALYALFNFGSIFILSKVASIEVFSAYIIVLSLVNFGFLFSTFFHSSPILVLFRKKWEDSKQLYLITLLSSNLVCCIVISVFFILFMSTQENPVSFHYVFLIPFIMSVFDILKKYSYSSKTIHLLNPIIASLLLNGTFFVLIFLFRNDLGLELLLNVLITAFSVASVYLLVVVLLKERFIFGPLNVRSKIAFEILKSHFNYSKWIILGGVAYWGYSQGIFIFAKQLSITDFGIAKVRTVQNILGIVSILIISIENYYIPYFSTYIKNNSEKKAVSLVNELYSKNYKFVILFFVVTIISVFGLYEFLYRTKFDSGASLIFIFAVIQIAMLSIRPLIFYLKAMEITFPFFYAHIFALIIMLVFGYFMMPLFAYEGMALTFLVSNLSFALIVVLFYLKKVYKS